MRLILAAAALAVTLSAPAPAPAAAAADRSGETGFTRSDARGAVRVHRGDTLGRAAPDRRDRRDRRGSDGDTFFPYRDYQSDTLWRADSFNDWWHERSTRAYPAWMARNQNCERQYWSGGGWRC